jgi:hypothetical protein
MKPNSKAEMTIFVTVLAVVATSVYVSLAGIV